MVCAIFANLVAPTRTPQPPISGICRVMRGAFDGLGVRSSDVPPTVCEAACDGRALSTDDLDILTVGIDSADVIVLTASLGVPGESSRVERFLDVVESLSLDDDGSGQRALYGKVVALVLCADRPEADVPAAVLHRLAHLGATIPPGGTVITFGAGVPKGTFKRSCDGVLSLVAAHNLVWFARLLRNNPIPTNVPMIESAAQSGVFDGLAEAIRN